MHPGIPSQSQPTIWRNDDTIAVVDAAGAHGYAELAALSRQIATLLFAQPQESTASRAKAEASPGVPGTPDLQEARVAFRVEPGLAFAATLLGIWRAGGIAVPLCLSHPETELEYTVADSDASLLVADAANHEALEGLEAHRCLPLISLPSTFSSTQVRSREAPYVQPVGVEPDRRTLILYTSGTTGRPKGVVLRHRNLQAQWETLLPAWGWRPDDRMLNVLPLHHTHGLVNGLLCALAAGATWETLPRFDAEAVWARLESGEITVFMAVPTIYVRLIAAYDKAPQPTRRRWAQNAGRLRLMISGSAALPVPVLERWREITGHTLLERYGMTEIGMALSNLLEGERRPGSVGTPLPGVEVRRITETGEDASDDDPAELLVRGPGVSSEYWRRPEETYDAFVNGWFQTGDITVIEDSAYRILGRNSVDIIKSGGYKISALEIEAVLRTHPKIHDCAVVGIPDPEWGQRVLAVVEYATVGETSRDEVLTLSKLRAWARNKLAPYKLPSQMESVATLPRNALGKVVKTSLGGSGIGCRQ